MTRLRPDRRALTLPELTAAVLCVLLSAEIYLAQVAATPAPKEEAPEDEQDLLERVLNYPFADEDDLRLVNTLTLLLLARAKSEPGGGDESIRAVEQFLGEVSSFTAQERVEGEEVRIVLFAQSDDKAVRRLREEIQLPPPEGGAVLRTYRVKRLMPPPIHSLFREHTEGLTRWCRFIAVDAEDKGIEELRNTISHELAHAYISSSMGLKSDKLPRWFHEGVALYISDAKDYYDSQVQFGTRRLAWSPQDYTEFRRVFLYLEQNIGRERLAEFIRESVRQQSTDAPLRAAIGTASYEDLRARALADLSERGWKNMTLVLAVAALTLTALSFWLWRAVSRRRELRAAELEDAAWDREDAAEQLVEDFSRPEGFERLGEDFERLTLSLLREGRALAQAGRRAQAEQKFRQAAAIAPEHLTYEVRKAWNELDGIYL